jgi:hypothetical protein
LRVGFDVGRQRRPDVYPDPEKFNPDRFLERHYSSFEFLPFGGGVRRCIGMAFARFEMRTVLSSILTGFELSLTRGRAVRHRSRGPGHSTVSIPEWSSTGGILQTSRSNKLAALRDRGILTAEEFQAQKVKILSQWRPPSRERRGR